MGETHFKGVGSIKNISRKIKLIEGSEPFYLPLRRRTLAEQEPELKEVKELVKRGILEPSTSLWGTLNVFEPKKDGTLRTTSDIRRLNSMTETDVYTMGDMTTTLDWLSSKKLHSTLDLKYGFFQVPLGEDSRPLTAIRTVCGLFQYTRLPRGLRNSPATFQKIVNEILGDLKRQCIWSYMDDATVGSETAENHLREQNLVLTRLEEVGVKLNFSKCHFGTSEAIALGHVADKNGIRPSEEHVKAIGHFKEPANGS